MGNSRKSLKKKHRGLRIFRNLVIAVVVIAAAFVLLLTVKEYKPADVEEAAVSGEASNSLKTGEPIRAITWNVGYCALGDNADFFMDGGKSVRSSSKERVNENLNAIIGTLKEADADIYFLQEVDVNSLRSYGIDQKAAIADSFSANYNNTFANNYKCLFVPYPIPPMGNVDAGLLTLSSASITDSKRLSLPCPFKWPVRAVNLKRCLLVSRTPLEGTDKELVMINLHLEAYDNGEGKIAQTKALLEVMNKERSEGNYVIVGGDFNQTFSTIDPGLYPVAEGKWEAGRIEASDFGEVWSLLMDQTVPSCRLLDMPYKDSDHDTFQYYIIDGFIVSDNIEVTSLSTLDLGFVNSDHNPVVLEFELW